MVCILLPSFSCVIQRNPAPTCCFWCNINFRHYKLWAVLLILNYDKTEGAINEGIFFMNKKHRSWIVYWGKRYIHVSNVQGFLWHESWQYFTCTSTSIKETVERISIMIIYIIPWKIFMGFEEHFKNFQNGELQVLY